MKCLFSTVYLKAAYLALFSAIVQFCCFSQGSFHVQNYLRLMIDYVIVGVGSNEQQYAHVRMNSNSI
jgi:hypothetical protein